MTIQNPMIHDHYMMSQRIMCDRANDYRNRTVFPLGLILPCLLNRNRAKYHTALVIGEFRDFTVSLMDIVSDRGKHTFIWVDAYWY